MSSVFQPAGLREHIEASQRERLLHAITVTAAEKGYGAATINDITSRAGVSKKTFYEHFADKQTCFIAAYDLGSDALLAATVTAAREAREQGATAVEQLRRSVRGYLDFLVIEETYARTFLIEILSAGPEAIARRRRCHDQFIATLKAWHDLARAEQADLPAVPERAYHAVVGATHEIVLDFVAAGRTADLRELEDDLVYVHLSLLAVPAT